MKFSAYYMVCIIILFVAPAYSFSQEMNLWTPSVQEVQVQCLDLNDSLRALGLTESEIVRSCEMFVSTFGFKVSKAGDNIIVVSISSPVINRGKEYINVKVSLILDGNSTIAEIEDSNPLLAHDLTQEKLLEKQTTSSTVILNTAQTLVSTVVNKAKMAFLWKNISQRQAQRLGHFNRNYSYPFIQGL